MNGARRTGAGRLAESRERARTHSVDELTRRNVEIVAELEQSALSKRSTGDRIIDRVTAFCGSVIFVWFHIIWFGVWIVLNTVSGLPQFDPFPFGLLTMVVSLEAIMLSTFILITQNRQAQMAERRNHLDLQINLLSEQENTKMLTLIHAMAHKMGIDCEDPELHALEDRVPVSKVVEQIQETIEQDEAASSV